jgi:hypothetical protein
VSKPWYRLNIDISNAVRADFDFNKLYSESEFADKPLGIWQFNSDTISKVFTDKWISYTKNLGLDINGAMLFYREPYFVHSEAHIDVRRNNIPSVYAINWVIDPEDDSEMVWYNEPTTAKREAKTEAGTSYSYWRMGEIADLEISRLCIGNRPTLVRVNIPHNIIVKSKRRWAISVRFAIEDSVQTWNNAVEKYKGLIAK